MSREDRKVAFEKYHAENPRVYALFVTYARRARNAGRNRYSHRAIAHRVRWDLEVETTSADEFKLNNNHLRFYAEKLMADFPSFDGFFELRGAVPKDQGRLF